MTLTNYLTFDGNGREAFEFYRSVFGGDFLSFQTFADAPDDMPVSDEDKGKVMHVSLPVGDSVLMGSDNSSFGPAVVTGTISPSRSPAIAGSTVTKCSPSCPLAGPSRCLCRRRFGVPITAFGLTGSASTGW